MGAHHIPFWPPTVNPASRDFRGGSETLRSSTWSKDVPPTTPKCNAAHSQPTPPPPGIRIVFQSPRASPGEQTILRQREGVPPGGCSPPPLQPLPRLLRGRVNHLRHRTCPLTPTARTARRRAPTPPPPRPRPRTPARAVPTPARPGPRRPPPPPGAPAPSGSRSPPLPAPEQFPARPPRGPFPSPPRPVGRPGPGPGLTFSFLFLFGMAGADSHRLPPAAAAAAAGPRPGRRDPRPPPPPPGD